MSENKLLIGFGVFAVIFILIAYLVPDDSIFKQIFSYILGVGILAMVVWFTPLGNPLKKYLIKKGILK